MSDPQNIWQSQPTGGFKMSAGDIRRRVHRLQMKARVGAGTGITTGLLVSVFFAYASYFGFGAHQILPRTGYAILSLCGIYWAYQAFKWIWPRNLRQDAPVSTCLEFYKSELERRRDYNRHLWRRSGLTFCFLGLAIILVPPLIESIRTPSLLLNFAPFFILLITWFVVFFYLKKRRAKKFLQELDELSAFERENRL